MVYCARCCLRRAMRIVNLMAISIGMGMIIYSLWLLKKWKEAATDWDYASDLPTPWFIYTCLGVGIVVCLSMLFGHMVANHMSIVALSIYILSISSILLLQVILVVVIFFKMNWRYQIDDRFNNFFGIHFTICRLIGITILLAQAHVLMLAVVLWALGPEQRTHCHGPIAFDPRHSFLVGPESQVNLFPSSPIVRTFRY
ncbi:tetraspanin-19-like [Magnolia sinica]|uniref:tetraspanin-19-like n=1 Tax=Magnolia sinica TaxID=86752 RepID=UPI002657BBEF|nr:tetraspanin-19-like [Magnolia sinica]